MDFQSPVSPQLVVRASTCESNCFGFGERHVLRGRTTDPGSFWLVPYWESSGEVEIKELAREPKAETYGKLGMMLVLPALFIYYGREVGWGLYVLAVFAVTPSAFMLKGLLRPARRRMNFLGTKMGTGFSIAYDADEEAAVLAFAEALRQRLREVPSVPNLDQGASVATLLTVQKRRGRATHFALQEAALVISGENKTGQEEKVEYWRISPQSCRNLLKTGVIEYVFFEDFDGEVLVRIAFDREEESRVETFVRALEQKLWAHAARRQEERAREYEDDETD